MKRNLLFIGGINLGRIPLGGELYKNQLLIKEFEKIENVRTKIVDTYKWEFRPKVILFLIWFLMIHSKRFENIFISASSKSTYILLCFLGLINPRVLSKTSYIVIGGFFPDALKQKIYNYEIYKNLKYLVLEGEQLKLKLLEVYNFKNLIVIPNFKSFSYEVPISTTRQSSKKFQFLFLGRISRDKGIMEIINAANALRQEGFTFDVHFYGPVEDQFDFLHLDNKYCGFLDFQKNENESYNKLTNYDCMLFPTYWRGEGFPGVILDAFIVGLPVIASKWNMNEELITQGYNGYLVEPRDVNSLMITMKNVMNNQRELLKMQENIGLSRNKYHVSNVFPEFEKLMLNKINND